MFVCPHPFKTMQTSASISLDTNAIESESGQNLSGKEVKVSEALNVGQQLSSTTIFIENHLKAISKHCVSCTSNTNGR